MQDLTYYSKCTCEYALEKGYSTVERFTTRKYDYPRYIDLCATCQHCIHCHSSADHQFKRQQKILGLCTRGWKGRECGKPIVRESMCRDHFHKKYSHRRGWVLNKPSFSAEERKRRLALSKRWLRGAVTSEDLPEEKTEDYSDSECGTETEREAEELYEFMQQPSEESDTEEPWILCEALAVCTLSSEEMIRTNEEDWEKRE
jgi:hypothetical protein